jgi:hypothetical protein
VPFFNQCSGKNVQTPYLDINGLCKANPENNRPYSICSSGCGVTSAAMVVAFYKPEINNDGLPPDMAALSSKNGMRPCNPPTAAQKPCDCSGTAGSFFTSTKTMGSFGLQGEYIGCTSPKCSKDFRNKVMDLLKQGKPLITVVGKSIFTGGGHYIVLTGVNGQGNITVNDPNSGSVVKTYSDGTKSDNVPPDKIFGLIGGVWYVHP